MHAGRPATSNLDHKLDHARRQASNERWAADAVAPSSVELDGIDTDFWSQRSLVGWIRLDTAVCMANFVLLIPVIGVEVERNGGSVSSKRLDLLWDDPLMRLLEARARCVRVSSLRVLRQQFADLSINRS